MLRNRVACGTFALFLTACVTESGGPASEPDTTPDDKMIYDCKPEAGAPHNMLQVMVPVGEADSGPAEPDDPDDKDAVVSGEPTDEEAVTIVTNERESGMAGHCSTRTDVKAGKPRYGCATADNSLRVAWPVGPKVAEAKVEISEKWLFGTKHYTAVCKKKA